MDRIIIFRDIAKSGNALMLMITREARMLRVKEDDILKITIDDMSFTKAIKRSGNSLVLNIDKEAKEMGLKKGEVISITLEVWKRV